MLQRFLRLLALSPVLFACLAAPAVEPPVVCGSDAPTGMASLCVMAVSLRLGPADEIQSYDPIRGVLVLVLPMEIVEEASPSGPDTGRVLSPLTPSEFEAALERSHTTGRDGSLLISVPPGDYFICAVAESFMPPPETVSRCEPATLEHATQARLLISHTPRGNFLGFSWKD